MQIDPLKLDNLHKRVKKFKYLNLFRRKLEYPRKKFVIYTRGRTGSTVLTDILNCHPDIFCDVEIFNLLYSNSIVRFPGSYIDSCSKRAAIYKKSVYGFKVKIAQLRFEHKYKNYDKILERLNDDGWKFIHLKRENFFRHKLSNIFTTATNVFQVKNGTEYKTPKLKVDCELLLKGIVYSEEVERTEEENLKNIPHIKVYYEKDLLDNSKHQQTADRIFKYLDLKSCKVQTSLKKMSTENLRDMIENYDEVYDFFKNTKYLHYLS